MTNGMGRGEGRAAQAGRLVPVRLMDRPEDYERMGTKPGAIEVWEDGRRDDDRAGAYEWWYFDFILDDGSTVVIHFNTKDNTTIAQDGTLPSVVVKITDAEGREFKDNVVLSAADARFGEGRCDVHFGPHFVEGDLQTYRIHVDRTEGSNSSGEAGMSPVGVDLTLVSTSRPWRPGAGGFAFGEDGKGYFTWLCAVPRGTVTGTLYYDGAAHAVSGAGYHDHQWGNMEHNATWDHWIWGRQDFGDYAALVFDIGTQRGFGYERLPMFFLEDAEGNLVMQDLDTPQCTFLEEYVEPLSGKTYPKRIEYAFRDGAKTATWTIALRRELEARYPTGALPEPVQAALRQRDLQPSTTRNVGEGTLVLEDGGTARVERSGELIYEFVYMGTTVRSKMEHEPRR